VGKHTPGPWIVGTEPSFNTIRIRDSDLDALPVATIFYSIGGKPRYQRAEAEANAALIAAAPELYEACRHADRLAVYVSNRLATSGRKSDADPCVINAAEVRAIRGQIDDMRKEILAAIAKAEGGGE